MSPRRPLCSFPPNRDRGLPEGNVPDFPSPGLWAETQGCCSVCCANLQRQLYLAPQSPLPSPQSKAPRGRGTAWTGWGEIHLRGRDQVGPQGCNPSLPGWFSPPDPSPIPPVPTSPPFLELDKRTQSGRVGWVRPQLGAALFWAAEAGRGGGGGWEPGGRRPPLRLAAIRPSRAVRPQPRVPRHPPRALLARGRTRKERDWPPRPAPDPGRAGIKPGRRTRSPGPHSLLSAERRGGSDRQPRPRPSAWLGSAPVAGRPARGHTAAGAPTRYLQPCHEKSPGVASGARGEGGGAWGGCCHRGCLKLPKVESRREAAARREQEGKEVGRCQRDRRTRTDRRTDLQEIPLSAAYPRSPGASQLCE